MSIIQDALKKVAKDPEEKILSREEAVAAFPVNGRGGLKNKTAPSGPLSYIAVVMVVVIAVVLWVARPPATQPLAAAEHSAQGREDAPKSQSYPASTPAMAVSAKDNSALSFPFVLGASAPRYVLNGVMQLVDGPRAIINNVIVGIGDVIDGALVENIDKDSVTLKAQDRQIKVEMK